MAKSLLIVESPAKAKTIQKYLGKDYDVVASKGHIKDLPKKGGVDIDNGFQETYEFLEDKGKAEVVKSIRSKAKTVDRVLLATDPDREGEAIAFHLREVVKAANKNADVHRVLFNEITKKGVYAGLEDLKELDQDLYEAQRTRRVLDRIGGYPLSSLLWKKLTFGLSAGRVQTPALRLIVDRQREIDAFVPEDYWLVEAGLMGSKRPGFVASLVEVDGEKLPKVGSRPALTDGSVAQTHTQALKRAEYSVKKLTKRQSKRRAPTPYTTSKLQQDSSNQLGMQPKRTMSVAQQLYEGVQLGRKKDSETVGLITYMRTDSVRISNDALAEVRDHIERTFGKGALPEKPNVFKTKKQNVQDAHEAIRPTRLDLPPDEVKKYLKDQQFKLYRLIWNRFVASQMVPAVYDQTSAQIEATSSEHVYTLRASGSVLKDAGWKAAYGVSVEPLAGEEEADDALDDDKRLPELSEGESLSLQVPPGVTEAHKQTEPPPYFNEASLVKKLEEEGIGRPSTYAEIISKVQARDYVRKVGNKLKPSALGKLVIEKLVADGFDLADIAFTRKLEEDLDAVAEAKAKRLDVLGPFHERLQTKIGEVNQDKAKWWPEPEEIGEACPECGKGLIKRWGRNGPFVGCTGYPECKYTRHIPTEDDEDQGGNREPEMTDYKCHLCGARMMKRWGRNGYFLGCSNYPQCKGTRPVPLGVSCPLCKTGDIIPVKPKGRGRPFYGCTNYNSDLKCEFRVWQKPVLVPCEQCKTPFMVEAGGKTNPHLKCTQCGHTQDMPEEEPVASEAQAS